MPGAGFDRDIDGYLESHQQKELLRFVAVGSVDDGKSTLIGRLLHDTQGIYEDQLSSVRRVSKQGGYAIDFSLFTDGLRAEREQGITIDVAYRYFATEKRKFIIADTPGHVQYTRNMATGASTADLAIILIDARLGVLQQSRRHAYIASLLGIQHLVVCVNKMDLVAFEQAKFDAIVEELRRFSSALSFRDVAFVPISALEGDNVVTRGQRAPWYRGPTLLEYLETVPVPHAEQGDALRYPVQTVLRPSSDYRAFAGQIAAGTVSRGDEVVVLPSGKRTRVVAIDTFDGELEVAFAPMSVALRLADEIDVSRGDVLVHAGDSPRVASRFDAVLVWLSERALDPGRSYLVKHGCRYVRARVEKVHHIVGLEALDPTEADFLELNDIGRVTLESQQPLFFDDYATSRAMGSLVVIDALTNDTVAAGMILGEAPRGDEPAVRREGEPRSLVSAAERVERMQQRGGVVLLTGLPASGKTSLAFALERALFDSSKLAVVVDPGDGDVFDHERRVMLARRIAEAGLLCIVAFDSPRAAEREAVRAAVGSERFVEVHVATDIDVCRSRDRHGRYPRTGEAPAYEAPSRPDLLLDAGSADAASLASSVAALLGARGFV
jgi:bifunctional enzyme CysN/CysC